MVIIVGNKVLDLSTAVLSNLTLDSGTISIARKGAQYYQTGTLEFAQIDMEAFIKTINKVNVTMNLPTGATGIVYTSTSNDGNNFESYKQLNADNTITSTQGRWIRVKVVLTAPANINSNLAVDFVAGDISKFEANDLIQFDGALRLKTTYSETMTKDITWTDGQAFTIPLKKTIYKKIDRIEVV
jgi:hypothetical protein